MVENRSLEPRDLGRGNTLSDPLCFSLMALADACLSSASFARLEEVSRGCVGVSLALAERTRRGFTAAELISPIFSRLFDLLATNYMLSC